jgi:hypothetical protein
MSDEHPSAVLFAKLRNETCKLLGYNADNLSRWKVCALIWCVRCGWKSIASSRCSLPVKPPTCAF